MIIKVNNQIKTLTVIDVNGSEYTERLLYICDALHYNSECIPVMTEEEFTRYEKLVNMYNEITDLETKLSDKDRAEYEDLPYYPDFDYTVAKKLEWLRSKIYE